jgi:hypothetical protein
MVTQAMADSILAEAMAGRETVPVTRVKRGKSGMHMSMKPDLLERVEYAPDNSRIGCQSRGMQSRPCSKVEVMMRSQVMMERFPQAVAHAMVEEWLDAARGMVAPSMVCTVIHTELDSMPVPSHDARYFGVWNGWHIEHHMIEERYSIDYDLE